MKETGAFGFETITLETRGRTAILTINRPRQLNALNRQVLKELKSALEAVINDVAARALVITGEGPKAFVAGADIAEMKSLSPEEAAEFSQFGQSVFTDIARCPIPTIAAVNGYALGGGCELALSCDIRIASETARFGQPEVGLGIIPGFGGTQLLARLCGRAVALELILSGQMVGAQEALRLGLVNRVVPEGEVLNAALALAEEISSKSPHAVRQAKKAITGGLDLSLEDGLRLEERLFSECFAHPDRAEGMQAFVEKRKPVF